MNVPTKAQYMHQNRSGDVQFYYIADNALHIFNNNMNRWIKTNTNPAILFQLPRVTKL